ncbi:DUF6600 domain-containing protein [Rhizobacter sp. Root404]|uniref:DUF6600 domain-containing protein n=1 Tax=Rhizobacter sp. Root404 TaxID=1736528 RepID=UPI000A5EC8A8|nr:DUF6600 domain-containing protein [Rhizobacter sp. Root404]
MSSTLSRRLALLARGAAAGWALALGAFALSAAAQEPDVDPPGRVARVSEATGQVWIYSPDAGEWVSAVRNQPLTSGDRIATDTGARAELQIGSTSLRLDSATELEVAQLDDAQASLQLLEGSAIARVRDAEGAGELEITTDEGRFLVQRSGTYRVDRINGKSDLTVYAGEARYEGPNSGLAVGPGQRAEFWIDSGGVAQYTMFGPVNDAFAGWSSERDRRYIGSVAERYVSPEMSGAAELDAYGRWEQTTDYGAVWYPTAVAVDWAPYSHGHWTWVRPWGWTWVDDAPWGFAPFHYGRWVYLRSRWCWTPGQRVHRPVYAPALVAWVGGSRGNVSVTIGGGPAVGWFPLAPREVYVPGYRVSPRYARNVNITNVTNVAVINSAFANPQAPREFENRRHPRAVTVVPTGVMTERRAVAPAAAQFRQAPAVRELISQPARAVAQVTAPVAAPSLPARGSPTRDVRPPPGFAGRPDGTARPGLERRDRDDRDRRAVPRDSERPARPDVAAPARPAVTAQPGAVQAPQATPAPSAIQPPAATAAPPRPIPSPPGRPGFGDDERRRPDRGDPSMRGRGERAAGGAPAVPNPAQPVTPQVTAPAAVTPPTPAVQPPRPAAAPQPVQEAPMMRPLPVQRGDERRREDRGADERRAPPPRPVEIQRPPQARQPPQAAPAPVQRPVEIQRPAAPVQAPPVQRPVEIQRAPQPVQPPPVQRPVDVPRPAVAPPPVQRIDPPRAPEARGPRADNPRADDNRRGEPRDQR